MPSAYGRKVPVIVIPATGRPGPGDTGLRHGTADLGRDHRVARTGEDARQLPRRLFRLGRAPGGLAGLGLDLPGYPGGGPVHPAVRDGRGEIPDGRSGALPVRVASQPPATGSGPAPGRVSCLVAASAV